MKYSFIQWGFIAIISGIISMALGLAATLFLIWILNNATLTITLNQSAGFFVGSSFLFSFIGGYLTMKIKDND
jgi:hypothetical protein